MQLKRFGAKTARANKPHRGMGQWGKPTRMKGLMAGAHTPQRVASGFNDSKGYEGGSSLLGRTRAKAPVMPREAGHYHPHSTLESRASFKVGQDVAETRKMQRVGHSERDMGGNTRPYPQGDSSRRRGPQGNAKGSAPPGVGKGRGVRGSTDSHRGVAGRGDPGRLGKHDAYKGRATKLTEAPSHEWFENLGSGRSST